MDRQYRRLTILPGRRDFLMATSPLAGSAILGGLDAPCCEAANDQKAEPTSGAAAVLTIRGHHLFDMLNALGTGSPRSTPRSRRSPTRGVEPDAARTLSQLWGS